MSYLNENGLVDGNIPAGNPCPFIKGCNMKIERCPGVGPVKSVDYSCALARLNSTIAEGKKRKLSLPLLEKVRDNMGKK